jgi:hypothetical protein
MAEPMQSCRPPVSARQRPQARSPSGSGGSVFPVLRSKLFNGDGGNHSTHRAPSEFRENTPKYTPQTRLLAMSDRMHPSNVFRCGELRRPESGSGCWVPTSEPAIRAQLNFTPEAS